MVTVVRMWRPDLEKARVRWRPGSVGQRRFASHMSEYFAKCRFQLPSQVGSFGRHRLSGRAHPLDELVAGSAFEKSVGYLGNTLGAGQLSELFG